jgi:hypothetical protein
MLVTLSGLGATLGVAVTGAIFNQLLTDRTVSEAADSGVTVTSAQAEQLDGVLAGTPGATQTLDQLAGGHSAQLTDAVREAFVSALGTALKLSAALIAAGLVLAIILLRRSGPVDAEPVEEPVIATGMPRPAPRLVEGAVL